MTQNVMDLWPEIMWVVGSIVVLLAFAVSVAMPQVARAQPAARGHRPPAEQTVTEEIGPDSYIDSFANEIEEAGGGLPPAMRLAVPGVLIWWLLYIVFNWAPGAGG